MLFSESKTTKQIHMFNNGKTTFRQLRDALTDVFSSGSLAFSKKVPFVQLYVTSKDGKFFASSVKNVGKLIPIEKMSTLSECDSADSVTETAKDIAQEASERAGTAEEEFKADAEAAAEEEFNDEEI